MENDSSISPEIVTDKLKTKSYELEVITNPIVVAEAESTDFPKVIYGRTLAGKAINKVGLKNMFESIWQNKAGVKIEDYSDGIVILTFDSEAIKNRVLKGQPWSFAGSYLILIETDAMVQVTPEAFKKIPFWVQAYGIPPGHLAEPYGEKLGEALANSMGDFIEFDQNYRRSFMRFRVWLDSSSPLLRGNFLKLNKQKDNIWVSFRYERLSRFCYYCGHLNHIQKDCVALVEEQESGRNPIILYNESIKTAGLGHAAIRDTKLSQNSDNKLIPDGIEGPRTYRRALTMGPDTKRIKTSETGSADDNMKVTLSAKKLKDAEEWGGNTVPITKKIINKGLTGSSPSATTMNRAQTDDGPNKIGTTSIQEKR